MEAKRKIGGRRSITHRGRRSIEKRIERKFKQFLYKVSFFDRNEKETVCLQDLTVPCLEIVDESGREVTLHTTVSFEQGEVTRDRFGRGTLQTVGR